MKRMFFIILFIGTHIGLVFLEIHKHTRFIRYSFAKQKLEKQSHTLTQKKELLTQELYALQDALTIQQFAQETLQLKPISLQQIRRLTDDTYQ